MTEQTQIRKKKRKQLLIRLANPQESEIHRDINEIVKKIFEIFRYHIGKANAINSYDLFKEILSVEPEEVELFQRSYLWNVIKTLESAPQMFAMLQKTTSGVRRARAASRRRRRSAP